MEEEHVHLVAVRPGLGVVRAVLAAARNLVDGEAEVVEGVGTAMEAVGSIAEDAAVPLAAGTAGCCEAVSAVGGPEVADKEAPI